MEACADLKRIAALKTSSDGQLHAIERGKQTNKKEKTECVDERLSSSNRMVCLATCESASLAITAPKVERIFISPPFALALSLCAPSKLSASAELVSIVNEKTVRARVHFYRKSFRNRKTSAFACAF